MRTTCEQCVYWEPPKAGSDGELGNCRTRPPLHEFWPVTLPSDWCGQARAREPEAPAVVEAARRVVEAWLSPGYGPGMETAILDLREALEMLKL